MDTQTHTGAPRSGPGSPNRIRVQFESGPAAAAWARNALLPLDQRLEPLVMEDVRLLVSELVTNSVRHADARANDHVQLEVSFDDATLHVQVADSGTGFEPRPREAAMTKAGGWGLFLVERLADRWGVARNSRTRVWFEIDLDRQRAI
ncbi:MAG: serine/threonine-protein kinase RsbW [Thermoleophilaceae bacterium]|nr:serine/threonine-protein kinase RsbW [Thermoleophilaceae bacterium]MEA2470061.1 serine/threonine-protein kinase RsbW [Thermoleophilaceae bacterium]